jgi:GntR family transcriptional regulator
MFLRIDPGSGVPIYRQIMDGVRYSVASGAIAGGDRLPSVREMATTLGVNPTTIQKAYGELEHLGVIETRRGQGTFVVEVPPEIDEADRDAALVATIRDWIVSAAEQGATREEIERLFEEVIEEFFGRSEM